jgi:hypothetical protein
MEGNSAESDPQRVDVQDPLPEPSWLWRRVYTFALSLISLGFIWYGAEAMFLLKRADELFAITRYMIAILGVLILFYMVAPSAEQIVRLIQAAKILQAGVPITRRAVSETTEGRTEVETTAGQPAPAEEQDSAPRSR